MKGLKPFICVAIFSASFLSYADSSKKEDLISNPSLKESALIKESGLIKKKGLITATIPEAFFNYYDFKFDSSSGSNYNRYQGHSKNYGIAGTAYSLPLLGALGVYIYQLDTSVNSQTLFAPFAPTTQKQDIKSNNIMVRLLKQIGILTFDASGGYGHIRSDNYVNIINPTFTLSGSGTSRNDTWFAALSTLFIREYNKYYISGDIRLIYISVDSGNYRITFPAYNSFLNVAPNTTKATWIQEDAELGYHINDWITPFVRGGLIQVAHYKNSQTFNTAPIVGSIPLLYNNKNGYRIGGGVAFTHNKFTLRLEQQYYRTSNVYRSNQTLIRLTYLFA